MCEGRGGGRRGRGGGVGREEHKQRGDSRMGEGDVVDVDILTEQTDIQGLSEAGKSWKRGRGVCVCVEGGGGEKKKGGKGTKTGMVSPLS